MARHLLIFCRYKGPYSPSILCAAMYMHSIRGDIIFVYSLIVTNSYDFHFANTEQNAEDATPHECKWERELLSKLNSTQQHGGNSWPLCVYVSRFVAFVRVQCTKSSSKGMFFFFSSLAPSISLSLSLAFRSFQFAVSSEHAFVWHFVYDQTATCVYGTYTHGINIFAGIQPHTHTHSHLQNRPRFPILLVSNWNLWCL